MSALSAVIMRGTRGSQPAATAVTIGALYCVTDENNLVERSNGTIWQSYSPSGAGTGTVTNTGTLASGAIVKGNGGVDVSTTTTGTGILTALGVNVGSAGAPVLFNGALGTPSSGTVTSCLGSVKVVAKAIDESVTSSAVLQDDDELLVAMGASQTWLVELNLLTISAVNSSGNIKVSFTLPASGAVLSWGGLGNLVSAGGSVDMTTVRNYAEVGAVTATAWVVNTVVQQLLMFALVTTAGTPGNFTLQWAQNASSGNATTIKAGSYLKATRVA